MCVKLSDLLPLHELSYIRWLTVPLVLPGCEVVCYAKFIQLEELDHFICKDLNVFS